MIETLSSGALPKPKFRYSPLVKTGPFYQTAGMVALDPETGSLVKGGAYEQTAQVLKNLIAALPDFGLTLSDLSVVRIYTTQFEDFPDINRAWEEVFSANGHLPARTALGVDSLPLAAVVEIEFSFYKAE